MSCTLGHRLQVAVECVAVYQRVAEIVLERFSDLELVRGQRPLHLEVVRLGEGVFFSPYDPSSTSSAPPRKEALPL